MKVKVSELTDTPLAWAVAKILQLEIEIHKTVNETVIFYEGELFFPDIYWDQGGPIMEQNKISVQELEGVWSAFFRDKLFEEDNSECWQDGPTPLVAAMRCYVASHLGMEIEIPEELL